VLRFETFTGPQVCAAATTLRLLSAAGAELFFDDNSGIGTCSAFTASLAAGSYYVAVEERGNDAVLPSYLLHIDAVASAGSESEANDRRQDADAVAGANVFVLGNHQSGDDTDFFAITVPAGGRSLRAEVIEGSATEACESDGIDSFVTLFDGTGVALGENDDDGRGSCSLIDGTGVLAADSFASNLAAGTYYLSVEASPTAITDPATTPSQFDYRLIVVLR